LAPILTLSFLWKVKVGIFLTLLFCSISIAGTAHTTVIKLLPPVPIFQFKTIEFLKLMEDYAFQLFFMPFAHMSSYCIGIVSGIFLSFKNPVQDNRSNDTPMKKCFVIIGWLFSYICKLAVIYAVYPWNQGNSTPSITVSALYASTSRTIWSLTLAWDAIAAGLGYGGAISQLLSWSPFIVLSRLTFTCYLIAPVIMMASAALTRSPYHFTHFLMFQRFVSFIPMSFFAAFILHVILEGPLLSIERVIRKKLSTSSNQVHNKFTFQSQEGMSPQTKKKNPSSSKHSRLKGRKIGILDRIRKSIDCSNKSKESGLFSQNEDKDSSNNLSDMSHLSADSLTNDSILHSKTLKHQQLTPITSLFQRIKFPKIQVTSSFSLPIEDEIKENKQEDPIITSICSHLQMQEITKIEKT